MKNMLKILFLVILILVGIPSSIFADTVDSKMLGKIAMAFSPGFLSISKKKIVNPRLLGKIGKAFSTSIFSNTNIPSIPEGFFDRVAQMNMSIDGAYLYNWGNFTNSRKLINIPFKINYNKKVQEKISELAKLENLTNVKVFTYNKVVNTSSRLDRVTGLIKENPLPFSYFARGKNIIFFNENYLPDITKEIQSLEQLDFETVIRHELGHIVIENNPISKFFLFYSRKAKINFWSFLSLFSSKFEGRKKLSWYSLRELIEVPADLYAIKTLCRDFKQNRLKFGTNFMKRLASQTEIKESILNKKKAKISMALVGAIGKMFPGPKPYLTDAEWQEWFNFYKDRVYKNKTEGTNVTQLFQNAYKVIRKRKKNSRIVLIDTIVSKIV